MAHKTFCDRCNREIKPRQLFRPNGKAYDVVLKYEYEEWGFGRKKWELCYDCAKAVREFLNCSDDYAVLAEEDDEEDECEEDDMP